LKACDYGKLGGDKKNKKQNVKACRFVPQSNLGWVFGFNGLIKL
jgi:hypothetical protein